MDDASHTKYGDLNLEGGFSFGEVYDDYLSSLYSYSPSSYTAPSYDHLSFDDQLCLVDNSLPQPTEFSFEEVYDDYLSSLYSYFPSPSSPAPSNDHLSSDDQLSSVYNSLPQLTEWKANDKNLFENAQAGFQLEIPERFQKMSLMIPAAGKSIEEIEQHSQMLVEKSQFINKHAIPHITTATGADVVATTSDRGIHHRYQNGSINGKGKEKVSDKNEVRAVPTASSITAIIRHVRRGLKRPSRKGFGKGIKKPNRRTPIPWSEAEHNLFLRGLEKHGKGDWKSISRHFVRSRTPAQVASHGQKYFIRLSKQPADDDEEGGYQEGLRNNTDTFQKNSLPRGIGGIRVTKDSWWSGYGSSSTYPYGTDITKSYISTGGSNSTPIWRQHEQVLNPSSMNPYSLYQPGQPSQLPLSNNITGPLMVSDLSNGIAPMMINNQLCTNTGSTSNYLTSNSMMLNGTMTALNDPTDAYTLESNIEYYDPAAPLYDYPTINSASNNNHLNQM